MEFRNGIHTIEAAAALKLGTWEFELVTLDYFRYQQAK